MLELQNISKQYHRHTVVKIPALSLNGHYWLQGANGSGKSTFLRMVGGLIPFDGDILLDGISIKKQPVSYRKLVSYAQAEPVFPGFLTGTDLISFYNQTRGAATAKTAELIDAFNIGSYIGNPIATYSSGMVKKLSLVLAFTGEAQLLLMDEPLVTLDQTSIGTLLALVSARAHRGSQFIFTSHQPIDLPSLNIQLLEIKDHTLWVM